MIPLWIKFKIPGKNNRILNLYFPVFLVWLLLIPLLLLIIPFMLLIGLIFIKSFGKVLFLTCAMVFAVIWNLNDLEVTVDGDEKVRIFCE